MLSLPVELYRPIIANLNHDSDRRTLLSASLCSINLRDETQRVLFRSTTGRIWSTALWTDWALVLRHRLFLEAVLGAPERLALYVRNYTQQNIGWEPGYKPVMGNSQCFDMSLRSNDHVIIDAVL